MLLRFLCAALSLLVATSLAPAASRAQGTGRSMDIDISIRSAGMGGASNAVFWGDGTNHWSNPSLLGYEHGVRYEWGSTQLVPGLADDVELTSNVVKAGWGGLGFVFSGAPFDAGGVHLDYGMSEGVGPGGESTGSFGSFEQIDSWGFGVSAVQLIESIIARGDTTVGLSRYVDFSFGMNFKDIVIQLAPAAASGAGSTSARDYGFLLRVTPVDQMAHGDLPIRADLALGYSVLSYNDDAVVTFINEDAAARASRHRRKGLSAHLALDLPAIRDAAAAPTTAGALARGLSPFVSLGLAYERANIDAGEGTYGYSTDGVGVEVALANILFLRFGHYTDRLGDIDGSTMGWGVALPVGGWGGVRYEQATFPQAEDSGLHDLERKAFSAWIDPVAIWRDARRAR